jgi:hypothetical protein
MLQAFDYAGKEGLARRSSFRLSQTYYVMEIFFAYSRKLKRVRESEFRKATDFQSLASKSISRNAPAKHRSHLTRQKCLYLASAYPILEHGD